MPRGLAYLEMNKSTIGAAVPLFRFAFYVYGHSGRTGGVPVTIGIAPPPMMMAGRSHCLRRFYHARAVTERKFHYIQIIAAESSASIGCCSACGAGTCRSFSVTLKSITSSCVRKDHGAPAARLPACRSCGMYPACPLFYFQAAQGKKYFPHKPFHFWGLSGYT